MKKLFEILLAGVALTLAVGSLAPHRTEANRRQHRREQDRAAHLSLHVRPVHRAHRRPHQQERLGRDARRPEVLQRRHVEASRAGRTGRSGSRRRRSRPRRPRDGAVAAHRPR